MENKTIKKCIICGVVALFASTELNLRCDKCFEEKRYHKPDNVVNLSTLDFSTRTTPLSASISDTTSTITTQQYY